MSKGLGSSQKGKVVESLIAATCIIGSDGKLSVGVPFVDDDGVDLMFTPKGGGGTIFVQVKSRFSLMKNGSYRSMVRKKTFNTRDDYFVLFAHFDLSKMQLGDTLWLIPSIDFKKKLKNQNKENPNYIFQSNFNSKKDMWLPYRLQLTDLPKELLNLLK